MKRSSISKISVVAVTVALAALGTTTAVGADRDVPTYAEFKASTHVDRDGVYIVNGDEPIADDDELRAFYQRMVEPKKKKQKGGETGLVVNTVNGFDDKWSSSQALNLSYCVSTAFGADHGAMVSAMAGGAALWESATSSVDFVHVSSQDGNCHTGNNSVLFSVEPVNTSQYIARAFFPSTADSQRNVLVDDSIWSSGTWEPADILGHELGHALGFRHEHTRPEAGTCFEDNNWRPLTPYDDASIMHYPQCNGGSSDLEFQASDAQGIRALYGS